MPELPEVEIHARNLRNWMVRRRITAYAILDPMLRADPGPADWDEAVVGRQVLDVRRLAKYLLIDLEGEHTLVGHLRMTGRFVRDTYVAGDPEKPTRLTWTLDDGARIRFEDRRRFGRVWAVRTEAIRTLPELVEMGPDALLEPTGYEQLREATSRSRRSIKTLLMDQHIIGGLGNICVIEILFQAGVAPDRPADSLTDEEVHKIVELTPPFLEWAIAVQGRRELIYLGEKGAENVFSIYRRAGTPCPKCETPILFTQVGGRGTYHCPTCQR